jgi:multicomponent Na+:H+ antiporter subunit G
MGIVLEATSFALLVAGVAFFVAGTAGVLRFASTLSRVHAVTKADNLGLGLVVLGLALRAESVAEVARLGVIWLIALVASAAACQLIARDAAGGAATPEPDPGQSDG